MILSLLMIVWLLALVLCVGLCQMAARSDRMQREDSQASRPGSSRRLTFAQPRRLTSHGARARGERSATGS